MQEFGAIGDPEGYVCPPETGRPAVNRSEQRVYDVAVKIASGGEKQNYFIQMWSILIHFDPNWSNLIQCDPNSFWSSGLPIANFTFEVALKVRCYGSLNSKHKIYVFFWVLYFFEILKLLMNPGTVLKLRWLYYHYPDFGCGVSFLGNQNKVNFCLKVTMIKGNFDVFLNGGMWMNKNWAHYFWIEGFKTDIMKKCHE